MLNFGVEPIVTEVYDSTDEVINSSKKYTKEKLNLETGDLIIITG